jgi:hypothetical protein
VNPTLDELGLEIGQLVHFRRSTDRRWQDGVVLRRERDGSVGLRDDRGRARAVPADDIEVRTLGPRGGEVWRPLPEMGTGAHQPSLFS